MKLKPGQEWYKFIFPINACGVNNGICGVKDPTISNGKEMNILIMSTHISYAVYSAQ